MCVYMRVVCVLVGSEPFVAA